MTQDSHSQTTSSGSDERPRPRQINGGFLNIDKPAGVTSMDVIRVIRRLTGQKRVGHGGTLDPDATGVLPICIGRASRFIDRFVQGRKVYEATAEFGCATDTYDASGRVTAEIDPESVSRESIEAALPDFMGKIRQVPPMYSAVKVGGERLYKLARKGKEIERAARTVSVYEIELSAWHPPELTLRVECGGGFYVRSLIHDLGAAVGNAAHMTRLVRKQVGRFSLETSLTLDELEEAANKDEWERLLYPIDTALLDLPAIVVDGRQVDDIGNGRQVVLRDARISDGDEARAYSASGELIALMKFDASADCLKPVRVLLER